MRKSYTYFLLLLILVIGCTNTKVSLSLTKEKAKTVSVNAGVSTCSIVYSDTHKYTVLVKRNTNDDLLLVRKISMYETKNATINTPPPNTSMKFIQARDMHYSESPIITASIGKFEKLKILTGEQTSLFNDFGIYYQYIDGKVLTIGSVEQNYEIIMSLFGRDYYDYFSSYHLRGRDLNETNITAQRYVDSLVEVDGYTCSEFK